MPCVEKVSFSSTSTEAVQLALRLARAHIGRQKTVRFDGHNHGWVDSTSISFTEGKDNSNYRMPLVLPATSGQSINALKDVIV